MKAAKEYLNNFYRYIFSMKIKTKFLLAFILIILITGPVIGTISLYLSDKVVTQNTEQLSYQIADQIAVNVEYQADTFENNVYAMLSDSKAGISTFKEMLQAINNGNFDLTMNRTLGNVITNYVLVNNMPVEKAYIRSKQGTVYMWEKNIAGLSYIESNDSVFKNYGLILDRLSSAMYEQLWLRDMTTEEENILYAKTIVESGSLRVLGDVLFVLKENCFHLVQDNDFLVKQANIAILSDENEIIMADRQKDMVGLIQHTIKKNATNSSLGSTKITYDGTVYILSIIRSTQKRWTILSYIPMPELQKNAKYLRNAIILLCLATMGIAIGIAYAFSSNVTKNINMLEKNMRQVEEGDFSEMIHPASYDEVGLLALRFNFMKGKIDNLINSVYKEQILKQQAEYQMLMAQINPHFLYNTLGSIKWLSNMKKEPEIEQMVSALIQLLKISCQKSSFITVAEEIKYIKNYVVLQKIRYDDCFSVEYMVDENVSNCYTMKLILQPLLENALFHGIDMSKRGGLIKISVSMQANNLIATIEDNGAGIEPAKLERIMQKSAGTNSMGFNNIGVRNVDERIRLYFGDQYGLRYISEVGKGTKAIVEIPLLADADKVLEYDKGHDS